MSDNLPAYVRTIVPFIAGWVITTLANLGVDLDNQTVTNLVIVLVGSLYYILVRLLEKKWPWAGKLLGSAKTPTYNV